MSCDICNATNCSYPNDPAEHIGYPPKFANKKRSGKKVQRSGKKVQRSGKKVQRSGKKVQRSGKKVQRSSKKKL